MTWTWIVVAAIAIAWLAMKLLWRKRAAEARRLLAGARSGRAASVLPMSAF